MGPHGERENISDPVEIPAHDLRNRSVLLHQLSCNAGWKLLVGNFNLILKKMVILEMVPNL